MEKFIEVLEVIALIVVCFLVSFFGSQFANLFLAGARKNLKNPKIRWQQRMCAVVIILGMSLVDGFCFYQLFKIVPVF